MQKVKAKGEDIEIIAEAVDVCEELMLDWLGGIERKDATLGTTADGAADMGKSGSTTTAWKGEAAPFGKPFGSKVDVLLQGCDIVKSDDARRLVKRLWLCGKLGTNHKEAVLDSNETFPVCLFGDVCEEKPYLGIQFVDCAVAFQTGTSLIDALSADKRSCSGIAGLCINLRHLTFCDL